MKPASHLLLLLFVTVLSFRTPSTATPVRGAVTVLDASPDISLSLPFIRNEGQWPEEVSFSTPTKSGRLFVTESGDIVHVIRLGVRIEDSLRTVLSPPLLNPLLPGTPDGHSSHAVGQTRLVMRESFGYLESPAVSGGDQLSASLGVFKGKSSSLWKSEIPLFSSVNLGEIAPGIHLTLRSAGTKVEKLFVLEPGANPGDIYVSVSGVDQLSVSPDGRLVAESEAGTAFFTRPLAYQEGNGDRRPIDAAYLLYEDGYGFVLGEYDTEKMLVIDPLLSSTYFGGSDMDGMFETPLARDSEGNIVVASRTASIDFPATPGACDDSLGGDNDIFVAKFTDDLSSLLAATYLGGSGDEGLWPGVCLTLGEGGDVYVSARSTSDDFPVTPGAYDGEYDGGEDVVVARLSGDLSTLLDATYLGASGRDRVHDMTANPEGNIYLTGNTTSSDFPFTPGAYDSTYSNWGYLGTDIFVTIFDPGLSSLVASTLFGARGDDYTETIRLDDEGNVYLTGWTSATNFPTTEGAFDRDYGGYYYDAFVSKLNQNLTALPASTYLGGESWDFGYAMELDEVGNVIVTGHTASAYFPFTPDAFDTIYTGTGGPGSGDDSFLTKLGSGLDTLLASTFLGDWNWEMGTALAVSGDGDVFVAGHTNSGSFPTTHGAFREDFAGGLHDGVISRFDAAFTSLRASTYLGGTGREMIGAILLDDEGNLLISGITASVDFPITPEAYDTSFNGGTEWVGENYGGDVFICRLDADLSADPSGIEEPQRRLPAAFSLAENYPNPFNPQTTIAFSLLSQSHVKLTVYDVRGRLVRILLDDIRPQGIHHISWDGTDTDGRALPSGSYLYRLTAGGHTIARKMVLVK